MTVFTGLNINCIHTFNVEADPSEYTNTINAVAISPDGTKIAAVGDKFRQGRAHANQFTFTMWDLTNGEEINVASNAGYKPHRANLSSVAFSADNRSILVGSMDKTSEYHEYPSVSAWSVKDTSVYTSHFPKRGYIFAITSHPIDIKFAICNYENIQIWQSLAQKSNFRQVQKWESQGAHTMTFSPDGRWLCGGVREINLWDSSSGELIKSFNKQDHLIQSLTFSRDSQMIVSGSDQRIKIWDVSTGEVKHSFFGHPAWIQGLVITADNQFLLSAGDTRIKIWNLQTGENLGAMVADTSTIRSMVLSQDGTTLVTGHRQGTVKVWKLELKRSQ
jgi:COMPASS component SWD3